MKKFYETEWQGIRFTEFYRISSIALAGHDFYQAFYEEFFRRYNDWDQLPSDWRAGKERWAEFVLARIAEGAKVLSVGCGLGAMEHYMNVRRRRLALWIHEVAPAAWRWLDPEFPEDRKLRGGIPSCLPMGIKFDLVYFATVDYALNDEALVGLLTAIRPFLSTSQGQCLLISGSFQDTPTSFFGGLLSLTREAKAVVAAALGYCRIRPLGQFWGWSRTREDYRALMGRAGYCDIEDGFVVPDKRESYWISGRPAR